MRDSKTVNESLADEAANFNQRIEERQAAGFVADLRDAVFCDYFYKSFFRHPYFMNLYMKEYVDNLIKFLEKYKPYRCRILEVGCGPGFATLEFARTGHDVLGIDIAQSAIETAREVLANNRHKRTFGKLEYRVSSFEEFETEEEFDAILFVGALHHFLDIEAAAEKAMGLLKPNGILLCHEPFHSRWRIEDAAQVALIRELLAIAGNWFEKSQLDGKLNLKDKIFDFEQMMSDVFDEYVNERDKWEKYQSPNDNHTSGSEILSSLRKRFTQLEYQDSFSFIYRVLGGIRADDERTRKFADLLYVYDKVGVRYGFLRPNLFYFVGRKRVPQRWKDKQGTDKLR
jgi:2-polyprenyl-3-methyl-5-hydroxy-6-metoxy-1,4-benzoquinol methylase